MMEVAYTDYHYSKDHRLNDTLSGITNMSLCVGEIFGPIVSSVLCYFFGFSWASSMIAIAAFLWGFVYLYCSDAVSGGKAYVKLDPAFLEMQ